MFDFLSDSSIDELLKISAGQRKETIPHNVLDKVCLCGFAGEWANANIKLFGTVVDKDVSTFTEIAAEAIVSKHPGGCSTRRMKDANIN
jgi:hypothetical protein